MCPRSVNWMADCRKACTAFEGIVCLSLACRTVPPVGRVGSVHSNKDGVPIRVFFTV